MSQKGSISWVLIPQTIDAALLLIVVWYLGKNRHIDQWNRNERPNVSPCICGQRLFHQGAKNAQRGEDRPFDKWCWENGMSAWWKTERDLSPTPFRNVGWSKDSSVRRLSIELLEWNIEEKALDIARGWGFQEMGRWMFGRYKVSVMKW